jgi:hypothetical protein
MRRALLLIACVAYVYSLLERTEMKPNTWQQTYGASRRKIDHKLLADLEKQIAAEERPAIDSVPTPDWLAENIGEQIQFEKQKRHDIARAFGRGK